MLRPPKSPPDTPHIITLSFVRSNRLFVAPSFVAPAKALKMSRLAQLLRRFPWPEFGRPVLVDFWTSRKATEAIRFLFVFGSDHVPAVVEDSGGGRLEVNEESGVFEGYRYINKLPHWNWTSFFMGGLWSSGVYMRLLAHGCSDERFRFWDWGVAFLCVGSGSGLGGWNQACFFMRGTRMHDIICSQFAIIITSDAHRCTSSI